MKNMSIKFKIAVSIAVVIVLFQFVTFHFLGQNAKKSSYENFDQSVQEVLQQVDRSMTIFFNDVKNNTRMMSEHPLMDKIDSTLISYIGVSGEVTVDPLKEGGKNAQFYELFRYVMEYHPSYIELYIGTEYGGFISGKITSMPGGYDPTKRPWYSDAFANPDKSSITDAYLSSTGGACITVTRKLANGLGAVGIDLSLDELTKLVNEISFGETGYMILVQGDGTVIANPRDSEMNFKKITETGCEGLAALQSVDAGSHTFDMNGVSMTAKVVTMPSLGWKMIGVMETREVLSSYYDVVRTMRAVGSVMGVIMIGIFILLSFYMFNSISNPIKGIVGRLEGGAQQVFSASSQVAGSSTLMAEGSSSQASRLEETSSALEEMTAMTRDTAEHASAANEAMAQTMNSVHSGVNAVERMNETISQIQNSSDETAKIIKIIDEIAFQTNLLALNAAVEAARAGEAGKGFAVVAEEVRSLAQRSSEAAKSTAQMLEDSRAASNHGVAVAEEVSGALVNIREASERVEKLVDQITEASREQALGIDQISTSVAEMDRIVQQNASNAEDSARASGELADQAREFSSIVTELIHIAHGRKEGLIPSGMSVGICRKSRDSSVRKCSGDEKSSLRNRSIGIDIPRQVQIVPAFLILCFLRL